jgi:hypothetical protein
LQSQIWENRIAKIDLRTYITKDLKEYRWGWILMMIAQDKFIILD